VFLAGKIKDNCLLDHTYCSNFSQLKKGSILNKEQRKNSKMILFMKPFLIIRSPV